MVIRQLIAHQRPSRAAHVWGLKPNDLNVDGMLYCHKRVLCRVCMTITAALTRLKHPSAIHIPNITQIGQKCGIEPFLPSSRSLSQALRNA